MKNRENNFFNSMINIKNFDASLLNLNQISFKSTDDVVYDIEYITMKSLDSGNFLYLVFVEAYMQMYAYMQSMHVDAYIEENSEDKYLISAFTDKNKLLG